MVSQQFVIECFQKLSFSKYFFKLLHVSAAWKEAFLAAKKPVERKNIIAARVRVVSSNYVGGHFDRKRCVCDFRIDDQTKIIEDFYILSKISEGRAYLAWASLSEKFILIDGDDPVLDSAKLPTISPSGSTYYLIYRDEDESLKTKSSNLVFTTGQGEYLVSFGDFIISTEAANVNKNLINLQTRLERFKTISPREKIEWEGKKYSVESFVPDRKDLEKLPMWYIPHAYRKPNTVIIRDHNVVKFIPVEFLVPGSDHLRITYYCSGKDILSVGLWVVLFAPDFPIGKITTTFEQSYILKCEDYELRLKYTEPLFKAFQRQENAKKWRDTRMRSLAEYLPIIKPGDVIMKSFINMMGSSSSGQEYKVVKKMMRGGKSQDDIGADEIEQFLFNNNLDEDLEFDDEEEVEKTEIQTVPNKLKYYVSPTEYVYPENIQDVIIATEANRVWIKGWPTEVLLNSEIKFKYSSKIFPRDMIIERIVYGGVVLNGVYYSTDRMEIKNVSISKSIDYEDFDPFKSENIPKPVVKAVKEKRKEASTSFLDGELTTTKVKLSKKRKH
jgi:hypothetical protein